MTYARSRLWLGISGVGFVVLLTAISLWFGLPHRLLDGRSDATAIAGTLLIFVCISIPSDLLGGYVLPRRHQRSSVTPRVFLAAWIRGVLLQAVIVGACAMLLLQAGKRGGTAAEIGCFLLIMVVLIAAQSRVARMVAELTPTASAAPDGRVAQAALPVGVPAAVFRSADPGFVGGLVGLPGAVRLIVPEHWQRSLAPDLLAAELTRRSGALVTGARTRGLLIALVWNVLGFSVACRMPGSSPGDAAGLVQTALWFTLWSFIGLLTLPSLNRPAVLELDRFALQAGVTAETLTATISELDSLQDDEPERTKWVERVFHPIPSVRSRVEAFGQDRSRLCGWQSARLALYLSWACFGFLGRAVHCNAGRPALWVLFPGD